MKIILCVSLLANVAIAVMYYKAHDRAALLAIYNVTLEAAVQSEGELIRQLTAECKSKK